MFKHSGRSVWSLLLLLICSRVYGLQVYSMQSGPGDEGSVFPSAVAYDEAKNELRLLSNVAVSNTATRCAYQTLHMSDFSILNETIFGNDNEVCHSLCFDDQDSRVYMVGHSYKGAGGMVAPLEARLGPLLLGNSEFYGMVVDMGSSSGAELGGGRIIYGTKFVYPLATASHDDTVYTASLYSGTEVTNKNESDTLQNPSKVFPDGQQFGLLIEAYTKKPDYTPEVSGDDTVTVEAFADDLLWDHTIFPENNAGIHNIAGIIPLGDSIIVAGSTNGFGSGLGIASSLGSDMDGFVVKLDSNAGGLYEGGINSYRVKSTEGQNEYINGICRGESDDVVYVTGSTTGRMKGDELDGKQRAFLLKLNVTTMTQEWVRERRAAHHENSEIETPAEGIACHVSHLGGYVYMAGNVYGGGTMLTNDKALSLGGSDVFVSKFHTRQDRMEWMRQIGSTGDEILAPRGGLAFTQDLGIVLYGQTNGDLYRARGNESSDVFDFFVSVIDHDGEYPDQIQDQTAITPRPTEAPTTPPPSTAAPTTVEPGCTTDNCTSYHFEIPSVKLQLEGVGSFHDEAGEAFSKAVKKWYEEYYHVEKKEERHRRLNDKHKVHQFKTDIGYWGHSVSDGGSTITYDQNVTFDSDHDNVDYDFAGALIVDPFLNETNKMSFLKAISESHEAFKDVTAVVGEPQVPDEDRPRNAAGQANFNVFIWIAAGLFGICICWGIYTAKHLDKKDQTEEFDEKDDVDRPEAPLDLDMA